MFKAIFKKPQETSVESAQLLELATVTLLNRVTHVLQQRVAQTTQYATIETRHPAL